MPRALKQKAAIQKQKVNGNLVKGMTPALSERYTQLMALYADNVEQTINFKYQLGSIFNDVSEDPKTYGKDATQLLMAALGISSKREIDRVMLFASQYTEVEVERYNHWHEQFPKAKARISWSHWDRLLVNYISREEREEWLTQICLQGWTCSELYRQMKIKYERGPGHGSRIKKPDSKAGLLQKMNQPLDTLRKFFHNVWQAQDNPATSQLLQNMDDLNEDALTELYSLKSNITEALNYLGTLMSDIETLRLEEKWLAKLKEMPKEEEAPAEPTTSEEEAEVSSLVDSVM